MDFCHPFSYSVVFATFRKLGIFFFLNLVV